MPIPFALYSAPVYRIAWKFEACRQQGLAEPARDFKLNGELENIHIRWITVHILSSRL